MKKPEPVYKIRNRVTGLYYTPGYFAFRNWTGVGKTWSKRNHVGAALKCMKEKKIDLRDLDLCEYTLALKVSSPISELAL